MRSGYILINYGRLRYSGVDGFSWPSTAAVYTNTTTATAYYLDFNAMDIKPSHGPGNRYYGLSLRCLELYE